MVKEIIKRKRGRPVGSSIRTLSLVHLIREELQKSLDILVSRNQPLSQLLADEMAAGNASKVLNSLGKFLPQDINLGLSVTSEFSQALKVVSSRYDELENEPITIDNDSDS